MPKPSKSSASSATRKKHARKAAGAEPNLPNPNNPKNRDASGKKLTKAEKAALKNQPKQKMYIPPKKPAPAQIDPLDGLESQLPGELVVVLKGLGKKAGVTKARSLEELTRTWIKRASMQDEEAKYALIVMIPVWSHHLPALLLHHDRRIRILAAQTHSDLFRIPELRESFSETDLERLRGPCILAAHDPERVVATLAMSALTKSEGDKSGALSFVIQTIFDPIGTYQQFNPPPPPPPTSHHTARKGQKQTAPPPKEPEEREKEEDAESLDDRKARIRSSAISALGWTLDTFKPETNEDLDSLLSSPLFWSCLYPEKSCPWVSEEEIESFGYNQTLVRRVAWPLVGSLLKRKELLNGENTPLISVAVLRSSLRESDSGTQVLALNTLVTFAREYSDAWSLEASFAYPGTSEDQQQSSDDDDSENEGEDKAEPSIKPPKSVAFDDFLTFLQLGCNGGPVRGYPVVVLIVDSIPAEILDGGRLFTSLFSALPGRALSGAGDAGRKSGNAWLKAILECVALAARKPSTFGISDTGSFIVEHITALWKAVAGDETINTLAKGDEELGQTPVKTYKLLVDDHQAARDLSWGVRAVGEDHLPSAWDALEKGILENALSKPLLICQVTDVLATSFEEASHAQLQQAAAALKSKLVQQGVTSFESEEPEQRLPGLELLAILFRTFGNKVFFETGEDMIGRVDRVMLSQSHSLLSLPASSTVFKQFLVVYLNHRDDEERCNATWRTLLKTVGSPDELQVLIGLDPLPSFLAPEGTELDQVIGTLVEEVLNNEKNTTVALSVMNNSEPFLSDSSFRQMLGTIIETFISLFESAIKLEVVGNDQTTLQVSLDLIDSVLCGSHGRAQALLQEHAIALRLIPRVFIAGWISSSNGSIEGKARKIFVNWIGRAKDTIVEPVQASIISTLSSYVVDSTSVVTPETVVSLFYDPSRPAFLTSDILTQHVLPSKEDMHALLVQLPSSPIDTSIAILDPLIPPAAFASASTPKESGDAISYIRMSRALLYFLYRDRTRARESLWALRHILAYEIYAGDWLLVRKSSGIFDSDTDPSHISEPLEKAKVLSAYMISAALTDAEESWRHGLVDDLIKGQRASRNALFDLLGDAIQTSTGVDTIRESRILGILLNRLLDDMEAEEAEKWILYARKLEKSAPLTANTIMYSITHSGAEPPRLDRYRNELAASLLGIRPNQARTQGTVALWKLASAAPSPDSDIIFIPQPRAVNAMKACQAWISEEDDNAEDDEGELESVMTVIFSALAPILQGVPGQHWDFMFDVIENTLENCSLADDATLLALARTLKLIVVIQDLASTNKTLRADWKERETGILTLVRDLATAPLPNDLVVSTPRSHCRELVLSIVQNLPPSLVDHESLSKMCHLVKDPSAHVQALAYQLLRVAAQKRTEHLVVEAGVDTDATFVAKLPEELIELLQVYLEVVDEGHDHNAFGHLLGWMITFDLFDHASFKVRSGYISQLRDLDLIWSHFIPNIFGLLGLDKSSQPLKLDLWAVDAFYVEHYDPEVPESLTLLAAHLYYRALTAVPSLIHSWIVDCKDRRLSSTIATYTAQYFSPVLIHDELAHLKDPERTADLSDENLTVKVFASANEVLASYLVDEHQLEIRLKIPGDWPLHKMEVKEVKRVGVDAERWRSWILAVQQTVWSHNGHIVDALSLFKKNVTLHFQGQVECAICYSIISMMDGSLPRKPCKTCKNKFHSSCLLKWFNTSHSSSCPLCRSDIL